MKKIYKCHFPHCKYETVNKSKIDLHHIIPREIDPKSRITIPLCKTHHAYIFVPESKFGQHSIKVDDSLQVLCTYKSNVGLAVHYSDMNGKKFYYIPSDESIIND